LTETKRFGDHTVTFISEYKNRVTKRRKWTQWQCLCLLVTLSFCIQCNQGL